MSEVRPYAVRVPVAVSTAEIRAPAEEERERIADVLATSLNFSRERALARSHLYELDDMRVAVVGDDIVATAGELRFDQWFGGRALACSAIWGVATLPEHRGSGIGSAVTEAVMRAGRGRGAIVSALFPAVLRPYRALGYELAGTFTRHRVAIDAIPSQHFGTPAPELFDAERDLAGVRAAYRTSASAHTGPVEPTGDRHWVDRIMIRTDDETRRAVVVREGGEVTGFLVTGREPDPGPLDVAFGLWTEAFVANTEASLWSLLTYVRRFGGIGKWFQWSGPPNDPIVLLMPEQSLSVDMHYRWMLRLLDVRSAFERRGWPAVDAEVIFAVDDPMFPDNSGPWTLRVERGEATVARHDGESPTPTPIGVLSAMFSGYLRPGDAVRLGLIDAAHPAVEEFSRLLSGPDPWCPFFF
jgi:predicted acetyltransferase